ncbi:Molybdenum cofactor sulfurase [Actinidia chinensis var. chinensis]|uniref:Molybdenum cofactor sulfurase n=1 Tax=Actinidia chinensis var. chinensis TaxID=1590841 RepID=A0A2R6QNF1_ACTCC|nr:Molybdenum cofactor sulfurase [Actinidia chinensis var. chinensis]PSS11455.1 Molybdenum cofactor sulfurase [Actinidia chinensis var. chinensis]
MQSPCLREACLHGCFPPFSSHLPLPPQPRCEFEAATASSLHPQAQFTNHESLPPLADSFSNFNKAYPQYSQTRKADQIRAQEYPHLSLSNHVCLDYIGQGLFSSSSSPPNSQFFDVVYKSVSLNSQLLYGGEEFEFETQLRKRIMSFMNVSEDDYFMVFTANKTSAFKLLAENYPFHTNKNLLTVYDCESEAVEEMIESASKRGTRVRSAEFLWPGLRIHTRKLKRIVVSRTSKRTTRGLFVFPQQSSLTGARYSYLWMSIAQENGWHVLLDASALGAKDMETLGLSLFHPDFLICSFYKIFGENPSGCGCLFIKKSIASLFNKSSIETSRGIVSLVPEQAPEFDLLKQDLAGPSSVSEIELDESQSPRNEMGIPGSSDLECGGLDHADSLGLILISSRVRYLVNWLVNALMSLHHPNSENGLLLVRIYGPKVRIDRGPAVAFNLFDWKGEKIDPKIVQKLADRNNISLSCGSLRHIWFSDGYRYEDEGSTVEEDRSGANKRKENSHCRVDVLSASSSFLTNFEDVYRLWAFVSRFLDADFVEKERWRYRALNQTIVEV